MVPVTVAAVGGIGAGNAPRLHSWRRLRMEFSRDGAGRAAGGVVGDDAGED